MITAFASIKYPPLFLFVYTGLFFAIAAGMGSRILPPNNACWLDSGSWLSLIVVILAIALVFADKEWE